MEFKKMLQNSGRKINKKQYMKSKDWEVYKIMKGSMEWACSWMERYEIQIKRSSVSVEDGQHKEFSSLRDSLGNNLRNLFEFTHKKYGI